MSTLACSEEMKYQLARSSHLWNLASEFCLNQNFSGDLILRAFDFGFLFVLKIHPRHLCDHPVLPQCVEFSLMISQDFHKLC